ncbi:MAG: 3-oxoacyl-ACP reductase FabG [Pseudomonadales bacterium]|jgi:3-oxoacyl-[acyl-carrier protein] reductase|nr:3-oxoacyl-ACP reductase FabG [Pseudomonadales bacterium]
MSIVNKLALVTGATRGIGKAIALELGRRGACVIGTATRADGAAEISAYLSEAGVKGKGLVLDVGVEASVAAVCQEIQEQFGSVEILVNNAGITRDNLLLRMKDEEWESVINTNLSSVFRMTRAVVRGMMKARWGRIISISSVVGSSGNLGQANYAASKAGIEGYSRALALEVGSRGITVNCIAPGFIDTDMTRDLPEEHAKLLLSKIPLGRYGQAEEIAAVAGFLASMEAAYITGETIHANGGMYMA